VTAQAAPNGSTLDILEPIYDDPVFFVRELLGAEPEPWQEKFLRLVRDNANVSVRSGAGVGKTTSIAWLILWFLLTRFPVKIAVTAPTSANIESALWPELRAWHRKLPPSFRDQIEITNDTARLIESPAESFCMARTASKDNPESLQGLHSDNMIFIIDEASGVDQAVFDAALGAMSSHGARTIMAGNPTRTSGHFYDSHNKNAHLWATMHVSIFDSSRVNHAMMIETTKASGENQYQIRCLGNFPDADDDTLIPRSIVASAVGRDVEHLSYPIVWGLDVARKGDDRSALAIRRGNILLDKIETWRNLDLMQLCGRISAKYENTSINDRPTEIFIDTIGIGAGVYDRLRELGYPVKGVNVSERPSNHPERFERLRDELWSKTKEWFAELDCCIPDDVELIAELVAPRAEINSSGKMKVESKKDLKKRGFPSPDLADALCLTMMSNRRGGSSASRWKPLKIPDAPL
jgi:phage terminase large subunit